ncbi:Na+/H+ antiporter NhaA [Streptomyces echinatus]|uniref:Na+/H+ antiporter NhaA n=1 Tax=Streptomyces echinatus TaxID=67293 RepID=UPI003CD08AD6
MYLAVPLFALANAGIEISSDQLHAPSPLPSPWASSSPTSWASHWHRRVRRACHARLRRAAAPSGLLGSGNRAAARCAERGFAASLLIATLAFHGARLNEAKPGILAAEDRA